MALWLRCPHALSTVDKAELCEYFYAQLANERDVILATELKKIKTMLLSTEKGF